MTDVLLRSVLWQRADLPALEVCRAWQVTDGYLFTGTVLARVEREPVEVTYEVVCTSDWVTRVALVVLKRGDEIHSLELHRDHEGNWWCNEEPLEQFAGFTDVDLGFTPCSNTLPVRRLELEIGETRDITAVWVSFPELKIEPLQQSYTRLEERRYRYVSGNGNFEAELELDELGLVVNYGEWWRRIAVTVQPK